MAERFTPGPWVIEDPMAPQLWIVEAGKGAHEWRCLAIVPIGDEDEDAAPKAEAQANAKLIVNSPRLYRALLAAYHALKSFEHGNGSAELAKSVAAEAQAALIDALGTEVSL